MFMNIELTLLMCAFVIACAYFNYKSGYKEGVLMGMEETLKMLEATGYIKVVEDATGETEIRKVPEVKNEL